MTTGTEHSVPHRHNSHRICVKHIFTSFQTCQGKPLNRPKYDPIFQPIELVRRGEIEEWQTMLAVMYMRFNFRNCRNISLEKLYSPLVAKFSSKSIFSQENKAIPGVSNISEYTFGRLHVPS